MELKRKPLYADHLKTPYYVSLKTKGHVSCLIKGVEVLYLYKMFAIKRVGFLSDGRPLK